MPLLGKVLEDVITRYAGGAHEAEAARARQTYLEATGLIFDDDPMFEERITAFLEWYTLERPMDGGTLRPVDRYLLEASLEPNEHAAAQALSTSHWSLFETIELQPGSALLEDVIGGGRFLVHERRRMAGMEQGDLFEARLMSEGGKTLFGRSFCFHPREAASVIRDFIRRAGERGDSRQDLLFRLAERRLRCERYRKVQPARIYSQEERGS